MNVKVLQQVLKCNNFKQKGNSQGKLNLNPRYFGVTFGIFAAIGFSFFVAWTLCRETIYFN